MYVAKATALPIVLAAAWSSASFAQAERHAPGPAEAEQPAPDKSQYSLFNPTPRELWRPLSADRPDFTESPYTVDASAVQLEMS